MKPVQTFALSVMTLFSANAFGGPINCVARFTDVNLSPPVIAKTGQFKAEIEENQVVDYKAVIGNVQYYVFARPLGKSLWLYANVTDANSKMSADGRVNLTEKSEVSLNRAGYSAEITCGY